MDARLDFHRLSVARTRLLSVPARTTVWICSRAWRLRRITGRCGERGSVVPTRSHVLGEAVLEARHYREPRRPVDRRLGAAADSVDHAARRAGHREPDSRQHQAGYEVAPGMGAGF